MIVTRVCRNILGGPAISCTSNQIKSNQTYFLHGLAGKSAYLLRNQFNQEIRIERMEMALVWHEKASRNACRRVPYFKRMRPKHSAF